MDFFHLGVCKQRGEKGKNMQIGLCTAAGNIEKVREIGYDYIELSGKEIMSMSDEQFETYVKRKDALDFLVKGFNAYCDQKTPIVGEYFSESKTKQYASKICERGSALGIDFLDIGAPAARILPKDYNKNKADDQCKRFLEITAYEAQKYNIKVLFEALHNKCCNYVNYSTEALKIVKELDINNLRINLDFYHMEIMNENFEYAVEIMPYVEHIHYNHTVQGKLDREYIIPEDKPILHQIKKIIEQGKYKGAFSVEPDSTDDFDRLAALSLKVMQEVFKTSK